MRDIAARTGISPATVSRALSGQRYVDAATRARVEAAAKEIGYRPNALARALRAKQTMTIGLIVPDIRNDYYAETATVLEHAFEARGYRLFLCISNNEAENDRSYLRALVDFRVDAIVYVPSATAAAAEVLEGAKHTPLIELLRRTGAGAFDAVVADDREGATALTRHLIAGGHRKIAMIAGPEAYSTTRDRVAGYRDALREAGLSAQIVRGAYTRDAGYEATRDLLLTSPRPTAIFSSASPFTVGVLRAIKDLGASIPGDVSLVAYEDPEWYAAQNPPLTCYALPLRDMALIVADRILRRLADGATADGEPTTLRFSGRLIERDSTARLA